MAASSIVAFWAVALLLIIVPGADWAFILSAGLRGRTVLPAVGGIVLGYAGITVVVAAGVGALVARTPAFLTGLTVAGGLYLMWHGATTLAEALGAGRSRAAPRPAPAAARWPGASASARSTPRACWSSSRCSLSSPTRAGAGRSRPSSECSGSSSWRAARSSTSAWGPSREGSCAPGPAAARAITRFSGAAMIVIGALLLADRLTLVLRR